MNNKYKKAMDSIVLSEELKNKILEKSGIAKKNNVKKYIRRISSGIAACIAIVLIAVTVFYNEKIEKEEGNVLIGNPMVEYKSIEEARKNVDFEFLVPKEIPKDYEISTIYVINSEMIEIVYENPKKSKIIYRTQKGIKDCSGDYTQYDTEEEIKIKNSNVILKSGVNSKTLVIWIDKKMAYACTFPQEIAREEIINFIENI